MKFVRAEKGVPAAGYEKKTVRYYDAEGNCYERGFGIAKNESEALSLFQQASRKHHPQPLDHMKELMAHLNESSSKI
jgi:TPR repeat protein